MNERSIERCVGFSFLRETHSWSLSNRIIFREKGLVSERRLSPKMAAIVFQFLLMKMSNMIFFLIIYNITIYTQ